MNNSNPNLEGLETELCDNKVFENLRIPLCNRSEIAEDKWTNDNDNDNNNDYTDKEGENKPLERQVQAKDKAKEQQQQQEEEDKAKQQNNNNDNYNDGNVEQKLGIAGLDLNI
jgi:hypothetical protein